MLSLADQVTQLKSFEWQVSMVGITRQAGRKFVITDPLVVGSPPFVNPIFDLDADANTGFLIRMLLNAYECGMSVVPQGSNWYLETFDGEGNPDEFRPEGDEHFNYLLARALVEAVPKKECNTCQGEAGCPICDPNWDKRKPYP